jgi:hypothetical protein
MNNSSIHILITNSSAAALEDEIASIEYVNWTKQITETFLLYTSMVFFPVGLISNILMLLVFTRKKFHDTAIGFYHLVSKNSVTYHSFIYLFIYSFNIHIFYSSSFKIWSVVNIIVLVMAFLTYYPNSIGYDWLLISNLSCKFMSFILRYIVQVDSWMQVLITFDRYFFVAYPITKYRQLSRRKYIALALVFICVLLSIANIPSFLYTLTPSSSSTIVKGQIVNVVSISCTSSKQVVLASDLASVFLRTLVPFVFIVVGNCMLFRVYSVSRNKVGQFAVVTITPNASTRQTMTNEINKSNKPSKSGLKKTHFIYSLLVKDLFFILTLFPLSFTLVLSDVFAFAPSIASPESVAANKLAYSILRYIGYLSNIITFPSTFILNRIFRKEFLLLIGEINAKIRSLFGL